MYSIPTDGADLPVWGLGDCQEGGGKREEEREREMEKGQESRGS